MSGAAVVFTCLEPLGREALADRRLRLTLLSAALESSDAVAAADERSRDALWRWMAVEAPVAAAHDGVANAALYRAALARR
jgi:hypothetical protein